MNETKKYLLEKIEEGTHWFEWDEIRWATLTHNAAGVEKFRLRRLSRQFSELQTSIIR